MPAVETLVHMVAHTALPAYMNVLLLLSSITAMTAHYALDYNINDRTLIFLVGTISIATLFTLLQYIEYITSTLNFSDSVYGLYYTC